LRALLRWKASSSITVPRRTPIPNPYFQGRDLKSVAAERMQMLVKRRNAMEAVAPELFAMESAIDDAILQSTRLTASLINERRNAGLSAVVGHDAIERSGTTFSTLIAARREIIATHEELGSLKRQVGLGAVMVGGLGDKPDVEQATDSGPAIRAVA
jgi:hypothetical protein